MYHPAMREPRSIDRRQPADWDHPLCPDHWFLSLPWLRGGRWRNIGKKGRGVDGTLTNMAMSPTSGWQGPQGRRGGFGALAFDGADDYVSLGQPASLNFGAGDFTYAAWIKSTDSSAHIIAKDNDTLLGRALYVSGGKLNFFAADGDANFIIAVGATSVNDGNWHHVAGVRIGVTGNVYVDGRLDGTHSVASLGSTDQATETRIGARSLSPNYLAGSLDSIRIYSRALFAAEVAALFADECAGCPRTLNRIRRRACSIPAAAGGLLLKRRRALA
jgi:hypothetical protein